MANQLKMAEHQAILGLARLKWSYRRIAAELGVDRKTVSRHVRAAAAETTTTAATAATTGAGPPALEANATIPITGSAVPAPPGGDPNAAIVITGSTGAGVQEAARRNLRHLLGERRYYRGERGLPGEVIRARQLGPDVIVTEKPQEFLETRRLQPLGAMDQAEVIDDDVHRQVRQRFFDVFQRGDVHVELKVPAERLDALGFRWGFGALSAAISRPGPAALA